MAQPIEGEDGKDRPNPGFWDFHDDQDADDDPFGAGEEEDGRAIEGPPQGGGGDAAAGVRNDVGGGDASRVCVGSGAEVQEMGLISLKEGIPSPSLPQRRPSLDDSGSDYRISVSSEEDLQDLVK